MQCQQVFNELDFLSSNWKWPHYFSC